MADKPVLLIVDDIAANIQALAEILKDKYRIKVATDGFRCLELAVTEPFPDLILLDIEMPGMNGYEVCKKLKQEPASRDIPVIFVTANDQEEDEERGLQMGAVDYITKPIRPLIVAARVNTHITLKKQRDQLTAMATHDQLTGLFNRHYLMESAVKRIAHAMRHQHDISLMIMDIDHFKTINDDYGHPFGDRVLQEIADILMQECRQEDVVTRFGGEEFLILFDFCKLNDAVSKSEKIRSLIEALQPEGHTVTSSFGVTQLSFEDDSLERMIKRADKALYMAKESGRNRIIKA